MTALRLAFFTLKARAREIGPTLPRYIVAIIISLPHRLSEGVRFLVRPTVAVALTVSYKTSVRLLSVTAESSTVEMMATPEDIKHTARALLTDSGEMLLEKRLTRLLPLTVEYAEEISTATVTVLMPPAVPTGEPPINIRSIEIKAVVSLRFS